MRVFSKVGCLCFAVVVPLEKSYTYCRQESVTRSTVCRYFAPILGVVFSSSRVSFDAHVSSWGAVPFIYLCFFCCLCFRVMGFPGGSDGKESACNAGHSSLIPGSGRSPGEGNGYPLQYSCLENPHGQRSLAGLQSILCVFFFFNLSQFFSFFRAVSKSGLPARPSLSLQHIILKEDAFAKTTLSDRLCLPPTPPQLLISGGFTRTM